MTRDERLNLRAQQVLDEQVLFAHLVQSLKDGSLTLAAVEAAIPDATIRDQMRTAIAAALA